MNIMTAYIHILSGAAAKRSGLSHTQRPGTFEWVRATGSTSS